MKTKLAAAAMAFIVAAPAMIPDAAAQSTYHGRSHYRCKRSSGTTGTIAGGVGGAVIGNAVGGGLLGTAAGGVGGALLGRHLDKKHDAAQNRRNGC